LNQVAIEEHAAKGTWIFPAPPGFVPRKDGAVIIVGVAPDDDAALPADLLQRITYNRYCRSIPALAEEDLAAKLISLGFIKHSEETWLKAPPPQQEPNDLVNNLEQRLQNTPQAGEINDLLILDSARNTRCYKGRWVQPKTETGSYVARRPQAYGAALWGFVKLDAGTPQHFLDLPTKAARWRGCDEAWHVQMALDYCRGVPQAYRLRPSSEGAILDFFSPIPAWAERRLNVVGYPAPAEKCLFSYWLPKQAVPAEEGFLQKRLWLVRDDDKPSSGV
jgi:hypothetical protein